MTDLNLPYNKETSKRDTKIKKNKKIKEEVPANLKLKQENSDLYQILQNIKQISQTNKSIIVSMGSQKKLLYSFDQIHFLPAQIDKIPLETNEPVNTSVIIGPQAKKPLKLPSPIMISGMSLGTVSLKVKQIFSRVAANLGIAYNSGEGGILDEELERIGGYLIGQYSTVNSKIDLERLSRVAAIEIRFGQGAYPGRESFLPSEKLTSDIASIRGIKGPEPVYSPAHHFDMDSPEKIKEKICWLKEKTGGVPIGVKIGCGNIEQDIKILAKAEVDFITLDGFGGGTGATDMFVRENVGIPIIIALPRAVKFLNNHSLKNKISIIASGGLRTSADFAKCISLGSNAVYIGTAALIAIGCEQFRICHTAFCPTGITTHIPALTDRLDIDEGIKKLSNFINICTREIADFARITGKNDIKKLDITDVVSLNKELSELIGIKWLKG